jgi:hypothetical protein
MVRIRIGNRERDRLTLVGEAGYLLVPGERESVYRPLERKGCVTMEPFKSHNTLRTRTTIVDIWRIALTPMGKGIVDTAKRDA